jgi:hypothetical protein
LIVLDLLVPTPVDASRADRSARAGAAKRAVTRTAEALPSLSIVTPLAGANDSRQYVAVISYKTVVSPNAETIKVEVGFVGCQLEAASKGLK